MPPAPPSPNPRNPQDPEDPPPSYLALCSHTHLFPGARCRLQGLPHPEAFTSAPESIDIHLRFSDGTAAPADLRTGPGTAATLTVAAHTTAAGTSLAESAWTVKEFTPRRHEVELTIGAKSPLPPLPPPGTTG
ncbi:hypothetical protein [Streptomyces sp. V2I9]|uniref:hypothetical protein n=1 Tax=Streptomyces sp. V2I9 TaxID=3042304 RepID=UPI0027847852|nr:hypothetical protein [Streptomyces sp. V2I9]MDQ0985276.1 hypothetical protein [Streptomyces sp. V2I9]